jgi:hypothetical protein
VDQPISSPPILPPIPAPPEPKKKSYTWLLILILFLLALGLSFFAWESYRLKSQLGQVIQSPSPQASSTIVVSPVPEATQSAVSTSSPSAEFPADWQTYTNTQYGFELKYPSNFKALTDQENLYGWPQAVVLFYSGGQSYDLPVEVWDSEAEYQEKYKGVTFTRQVFQKGDKFITLVNMNNDPVVDQIIASFKSVN